MDTVRRSASIDCSRTVIPDAIRNLMSLLKPVDTDSEKCHAEFISASLL
jgi:hypothetical protein